MPKRHKIDTFLLAAALFTISGTVLAYNIVTSDGGGVSASLSELTMSDTVSVSLIHDSAAENLSNSTIFVNTVPEEAPVGATLPPIVTPPTE